MNSELGLEGVEVLGIAAITLMVVCYALEHLNRMFIALFAVGCALAALYAYLIGSIPFLVAEGVWAGLAARRWYTFGGFV
jgi:hypothetical protein